MDKRLFLVDGTAQLFRAYFAIRDLTAPDGTPTNAVYGFANMLRKLLKEESPGWMAIAFDLPGKTFRHDRYPDYKANRPPTPADLSHQLPLAKQACQVLGLTVVEREGYEADDLIATFTRRARAAGHEVVVVASDKDLLQLVGDGVRNFNPVKEEYLDAADVERSFGVPPERVVDVLALMGDSVDNIPGVPGIGEKTAIAIVRSYGGLGTILERARRFAELGRARDALVDILDLLRKEKPATAETLEALQQALRGGATALDGLLEVEADPDYRARLEVVRPLVDAGCGKSWPERAGEAGGSLARELSALKKELKGLDRGSQRRAWVNADEHREQALLSRELATLQAEVPDETALDALAVRGLDVDAAREMFQVLGFRSWLAELDDENASLADQVVCDSRLLLEPDELASFVDVARAQGRLAVEVEADGSDALRAQLVGIGLAIEGDAAYLPLAHDELGAPRHLTAAQAGAGLAPILADPAVAKWAHDQKRQGHLLRRAGWPVDGWALDTQVAAFMINPSRSGETLERIATEFLGREVSPRGVDKTDAEGAGRRSGGRAAAVHAAAPRLLEQMDAAGVAELYDRVDGPLLPLLAEMEAHGIVVDVPRLETMSAVMQSRLDELRGEIHQLAGVEFNVDSPKQLREVLFERLELKSRRRTAKGKELSTDAQTLEELSDKHPIAPRLLAYRELSKLKGTYVDSLPQLVDPATGRVHTHYHPTGAATGRLSSSDPNLQNIPARSPAGLEIREAFVPEEGYVFLAADYSQVELRILAHLCQDEELIAAFKRGDDIHRHTASLVFGVTPDLVSDPMRRQAKAVNFGILYGMSETRLAREQGLKRTEARQFIRNYFERFHRVRDYIDDVREEAARRGSVRTLFGRVRYFPQLQQSVNRGIQEQALRGAVNTTVQGTAADLMKMAMLDVKRVLDGHPGSRILLQVHDELLLEVPRGDEEAVSGIVREAMEGVGELTVPLAVDQKVGKNWREVT